ncbi:MAG: hypothetical protein ACLQLC_11955 [Candidatus Sulfotelmatobacter sp.]
MERDIQPEQSDRARRRAQQDESQAPTISQRPAQEDSQQRSQGQAIRHQPGVMREIVVPESPGEDPRESSGGCNHDREDAYASPAYVSDNDRPKEIEVFLDRQ